MSALTGRKLESDVPLHSGEVMACEREKESCQDCCTANPAKIELTFALDVEARDSNSLCIPPAGPGKMLAECLQDKAASHEPDGASLSSRGGTALLKVAR